jgi:hypothetical protein
MIESFITGGKAAQRPYFKKIKRNCLAGIQK